ncbi:MAG: single-stranded DNA-binding protein [Lachnospiraceae bacterium]
MHSKVFVIGFVTEVIGNNELLIRTDRLSGVPDMLPVRVTGIKNLRKRFQAGHVVQIIGTYRTENDKGKLLLFIEAAAADIKKIDENREQENRIDLCGVICKPPVFRETPKGRLITDMIIAVNHQDGRSSYIPCIAWGTNARIFSVLNVGTKISAVGRIQSREYIKAVSGHPESGHPESEKRTAYEVSISKLKSWKEGIIWQQ